MVVSVPRLGAMRKERIRKLSLGIGLLCAMAWYLVFGWDAFEYHDPHIDWSEVSVAALISFVAGWGLVHLAAWLFAESSERRSVR
jgi:hypothetical protein